MWKFLSKHENSNSSGAAKLKDCLLFDESNKIGTIFHIKYGAMQLSIISHHRKTA